jgi:hypothetical protein
MVYHCTKCDNINYHHPFKNDICQECGGEYDKNLVPVIKVDPGDCVLCDACNEEQTDQEGGCLVGSWLFCAKCTKNIKYPEEITAECPIELTTHDWIMTMK